MRFISTFIIVVSNALPTLIITISEILCLKDLLRKFRKIWLKFWLQWMTMMINRGAMHLESHPDHQTNDARCLRKIKPSFSNIFTIITIKITITIKNKWFKCDRAQCDRILDIDKEYGKEIRFKKACQDFKESILNNLKEAISGNFHKNLINIVGNIFQDNSHLRKGIYIVRDFRKRREP